jgi:polyhydroxyalkanoate synthase
MAMEYLRGLCQRDDFAQGRFPVFGTPVSPGDITLPVFAVACETDHIAAWKGSFNGVRQFGSKDKTFVLSQSGHIAGIVNPPSKGKYGHYVSEAPMTAPDAWKAAATFHPGSWWPRWATWLSERSGTRVKARTPGDSDHPVLAPAPGTYVTAKPEA